MADHHTRRKETLKVTQKLAKEKPCTLYVKLAQKIPKDLDFGRFLSTRLTDAITFSISRLNIDSIGNTTAVIQFPSNRMAKRARAEINNCNKLSETKLYVFDNSDHAAAVELHRKEVIQEKLEHHLNLISTRAENFLKEHQKKLKTETDKLQGIKRLQKKGMSLEQFQQMDSEEKALSDKVNELQLQEKEFRIYLRSIVRKVEETKVLPKFDKEMLEIRKAFAVECERLRNALPMYARRTTILDTVKQNQVSVILGETGSGKSTQMPQFIYQAGFSNDGIIVCTQPRKIAAISLATYVAAEMASSVGQLVGYQVGMKMKKNKETKIMYMTDHILLNECLKDHLLSAFSCIIVDEAHERSIYTDLLLGMIKKCLVKRPELRVIVTSATIDPQVFVNFFGGCPVVKVSGRMFPVEIIWQNEQASKDSFEKYEDAAVSKAIQVHKDESEGGILVFLTSPLEVERCCQAFEEELEGRNDFLCLQLHGRLQADEQQRVFEDPPPGKRKVVFATNSAETSITIKNVKFVIDTGCVKEMQYDAKRRISSLNVTSVTKSSAEQRKGRAGRTSAGKCFRLYTEKDFNEMRPENVPEILRVHLGHAILKLMDLGVNPLEFEFVQSPSKEAMESALHSLFELGAVKDHKITELGKWIAKLPVDPEYGVLISEALKLDVGIEAMVIAACAKGGSIFYRAGTDEEKQKADRLKVRFCNESGDLITMLSVFKEWHVIPEKEKGRWCCENCINGKAIKGVRETVNEIRLVLKNELKVDIKFDLPEAGENVTVLVELISRVLKSNISHFLGHPKAGYLVAEKCEQVHLHPSSTLLPLGISPEWIIFQYVMSTSKDFAMVVTSIPEELVEKAVQEKWLKISIEDLKSRKLAAVYTLCVGSQCFREFVGQRYSNIPKKEAQLNELCSSVCSKCITVIDADRDKGKVTIYSAEECRKIITDCMEETIDMIRQPMISEEVEQPLSSEKPAVRALIGEGGCVKTIYMPEEYRTVLIHCSESKVVNVTEEEVNEHFKKFGLIQNCTKNAFKQKIPTLWGYLMFKSTKSALEAVKETSNNADMSARPKIPASFSSLGEIKAKVIWCRRKSRGFGFVQLRNVEDIVMITRQSSSIMVAESRAKVTTAKNSPDQVYVGRFSTLVTPDMLRHSFAESFNLHPLNDIGKVNITREKAITTQEMLNSMERELKHKIEEYIAKERYTLNLKKTNDWDNDYVAFVSFKDPEEGYRVCKEIDRSLVLNGEVVTMKADLRSSIYVPKRIYEKTGTEIEECRTSIEEENSDVEINLKEMKNGNIIIDFRTNSIEELVQVKKIFHEMLKGDTYDCSSENMAKYLFTRTGRQKLQSIMNQTQTVIIVDNRVMTVSVHGLKSNRQKARTEIDMYLEGIAQGGMKQVNLKGPGKPPGVMKNMMQTFGSDLATFVEKSGLSSVDIDQRYHKIKMIGSESALQRGNDIIENLVKEIKTDKQCPFEADLPDCVVCFCPIDEDELYRLEACGDPYCKDCIKRQIEIAVTSREFPLKCGQEGCETQWAWKDVINISRFGFVVTANLVSSSVSCFVAKNKDKFRFCTTADCPMVYKVTEDGHVFQCPVCEIRICSSCHVQSHSGMSCAMYKSMKEDGGSLHNWLRRKPDSRKQCPNCTTPIEKIAGCNNMTCEACKKHICWVCLKYFDDDQGCYGHLQQAHGSFN